MSLYSKSLWLLQLLLVSKNDWIIRLRVLGRLSPPKQMIFWREKSFKQPSSPVQSSSYASELESSRLELESSWEVAETAIPITSFFLAEWWLVQWCSESLVSCSLTWHNPNPNLLFLKVLATSYCAPKSRHEQFWLFTCQPGVTNLYTSFQCIAQSKFMRTRSMIYFYENCATPRSFNLLPLPFIHLASSHMAVRLLEGND